MQISNSMSRENETINEIEYKLAGIFSAIYSVKEVLKENHLTDSTTETIIKFLLKDYETLEKYLTEKGVIHNERKSWIYY